MQCLCFMRKRFHFSGGNYFVVFLIIVVKSITPRIYQRNEDGRFFLDFNVQWQNLINEKRFFLLSR